MSIINKIKTSVERITGLDCLYGSIDDINTRLEDQIKFPCAFFTLVNDGQVVTDGAHFRESVDVAMFVVTPTEFDFDSVDNEQLIEGCKNHLLKWLNGLYSYSGLRFDAVLSSSRVYNTSDTILTGYAIRVRLIETQGNTYCPVFYKVTTQADPIGAGTLTGAGRYAPETEITLTANEGPGYDFVRWVINGETASTDPEYTFTVTKDVNATAEFEGEIYTVTTATTGTGTATGGGEYAYNTTCTLVADEGVGYDFKRWVVNGQQVSTSPTYSFVVTGNVTVTAVFEIEQHTVTATAVGMGNIEGAGVYEYGQTCTLTATEGTGYDFLHWLVDGQEVATTTSYSFTVTEDVNVTAVFEIEQYVITATTTGTGIVNGSGTYNYGSTCTLAAVEGTGYDFARWTINGVEVGTQPTYSFLVTGDVTVNAVFELEQYAITASPNNVDFGSVTGSGTYNYGSSVTVTATPSTGYHFVNWLVGGQEVSTDATYTFTATGDTSLIAVFAVNQYTVTTATSGTGTASGGGVFNYGSTCTLVANEGTGYDFARWTVNGTQVSTNSTYSFTVTDDVTVTAVFEAETYTVTANVNDSNYGSATGSGSYTYGSSVTVVATPSTGYHFVNWTVNGSQVSTNASYTFTATSDVTLLATFAIDTYNITTSVNDSNYGSATGGGTYNYGTSVTVTATPTTGYEFVEWQVGGSQVSTSASYTFTATSDVTIMAMFQEESRNYLTFTAEQANSSVKLEKIGTPVNTVSLEYSKNGGAWTSYTIDDVITLTSVDDYVQFRGNNQAFNTNNEYNRYWFRLTGKIAASGEITSLYDSTCQSRTIPSDYFFYKLFYYPYNNYHDNSLTTAPVLPATTLTSGCYCGMFQGCISLTTAPVLPATTLATYCYWSMFQGCISLTTAPVLPATTLATYCYWSMFQGCISLTTAPVLPATTLRGDCYRSMFQGCISLTTAPVLPATTLAGDCYQEMFKGCTSLVTAPVLPATTVPGLAYYSMFEGCTNLVNVGEISATSITGIRGMGCMFKGCTSLVTAPEIHVVNLSNSESYIEYMFRDCTSLTTAPTVLPATTLGNYCYQGMFWGCTSLTTAPELPATTLREGCYRTMFWGCTSLTKAPVLPAKTLSSECYRTMFWGCTSLNYVEVAFTSWSNATSGWLTDVAATGDFICPSTLSDTRGTSNIPVGWNKVTPVLTFTAEQANSTIKLSAVGSPSPISLTYSTNGGTTEQAYTIGDTITLTNVGDTVQFWGTNSTFSKGDFTDIYRFSMTGRIAASGYITSLYDPTCASTSLSSLGNYCFSCLFQNCSALTTAPVLPATTLTSGCYFWMFLGCTSLTAAPALPATTLAYKCYQSMLRNCTSLATAPKLPATTLAQDCYHTMFQDCTSLTTPPVLPATTLEDGCYQYMFYQCTSLTTIPAMNHITSVGVDSCQYMFKGCTGLTDLSSIKLFREDTTTIYNSCQYMFYGCTNLTKSPELMPNTVPGNAVQYTGAYALMFNSCTKLNEIKTHQTSWNSYSNNYWLGSVSSSGTFICPSELPDRRGSDYIPSNWTRVDL